MAAGRWSHRPFVRCCASAPAGRWLFGFGFYHQYFITKLASAAGVEGILLPPQRQAVTLAVSFLETPYLSNSEKGILECSNLTKQFSETNFSISDFSY